MFQLLFINSVKAFGADKTGSVVVELNFFFLKTFNFWDSVECSSLEAESVNNFQTWFR